MLVRIQRQISKSQTDVAMIEMVRSIGILRGNSLSTDGSIDPASRINLSALPCLGRKFNDRATWVKERSASIASARNAKEET
jgi:hypothetical protein